MAAEVRGHVRGGVVSESVDFVEPIAGEATNDRRRIFGRLKLDVDRFNDKNDLFSLDVRDNYDFFGLLDQQALELLPANKAQVRQLAYHRIPQRQAFFYSLGRFPIDEAGLVAHDGVLAGLKTSPNFAAGAFAGIAPKDVLLSSHFDNVNPDVTYDPLQAGAFLVYDKQEPSGKDSSLYASVAIARTPSFDVPTFDGRVTLFSNLVYNFARTQRLAALMDYDVDPRLAMRRLRLSHYYFSESTRVHSTYTRVDTVQFQPLKTFREQLPASAFDSTQVRPTTKFSKTLGLTGKAQYDRRYTDGLTRTDLAAGPMYTGNKFGATLLLGQRANFISDDSYARVMLQYYVRRADASLTFEQGKETYEDGTVLNPQSIMLDAGFYFGDRIRGGFGYNLLQDERVKVAAMLLTVGYRFGSGEGNEPRETPAPLEEVQ